MPVDRVETEGVSEGLAGGDSVLEPDRGDAIGVMSAEFVDPALEREFQLHHLDSTARRAISTSVVGASSCFVFTVSDFTRLGFGSHFVLLLALRSLVLLASVLFAVAVRRNPVRSLSWNVVSTLESAVLAVLFVVMALRPEETEINNLGISVTIIAMFLLVPNRFPAPLPVGQKVRMRAALQKIAASGLPAVAAVSHGAAINVLLADLTNGEMGTGKTKLYNGGITVLEGGAEGFALAACNLKPEEMALDEKT